MACFMAESRREERCKHELIEHPVSGGQKILRTSCEKRYDVCQRRSEFSSVPCSGFLILEDSVVS